MWRRRISQGFSRFVRVSAALLSVVALDVTLFAVVPPIPVSAADLSCAAPANEIVAENCKTGNAASEWDVSGAGDPSIQGFATDISVNKGETIHFKIDTTSADYGIDIYRLGYYDGDGARKVGTIPTANTMETEQDECLFINGTTGDNLVDCGNWTESASWAVPTDAVSGIYIAKPTRADNDGASHIVFIVRDDGGGSDLLFQTSDTTWQAYNGYGGYSLYANSGHAYKVSYNRPFTTRATPTEDWLMNAEYPMLRWLERNGYDVSYSTDVDSDRRGGEILEHETFLSVGHDEYWSAAQRTNVEAARDAGVNLAFFSGNEIYWKTRFEPSTADGASTDYRTLVSYKEGDAQGDAEHFTCFENFDCDPNPTVWTGLWRQNAPLHDGAQPENALSGQISWGTADTAIEVPAEAGSLRFWRNAGITSDTTLTAGTLGYEIDWEQAEYAASYPAGRITLSDTTVAGKNHKMSLYRAPSGALVFGAGTVQWSWGLDANHDRLEDGSTEDARIQQATVNVLSDMQAQPATLQSGLVVGGPLDTTLPTATITDPAGGATVAGGSVTISGTATDTGGVVAAVEVSTDGGTTWAPATGTTTWTYTFSASDSTVTAQARAVDDAANIGPAATVTFVVGSQTCPCSIWAPTFVGGGTTYSSEPAVELGVKFRTDVAGYITGIRYWRTAEMSGIHVGHLWSAAGTQLGEITFTDESASGWQEATFGAPIAIAANTTYIASYHAPVGYSASSGFAVGVDSPPLHALADGVDGPNGVYKYGPSGTFPNDTFQASNYWVDVVFENSVGPDTTPPTVSGRSPVAGSIGVAVMTNVTAVFNEPMAAASISGSTVELRDPSSTLVAATVSYNAGTRTAVLDPTGGLDYSTTYTATVQGAPGGVSDVAGNALAADVTWTFTTAAMPPPPPEEGPGGPVLVVSSAANPFSRYYTEILRNEGLNAFYAVDITAVDATLLAGYDVVVLGEVAVDAAQATMFASWVNAGGNLIAMRPDPDLAGLLGLTAVGTNLSDAYLQIDTGAGKPGAGLVSETIQFHGTADHYALDAGTAAVATLYSNASTSTGSAAVTLRSVGTNGGQAAAFTYDLAKSVVYTRQGNPAQAGQETDGQDPPIMRADDMFFPDWVDFDKIEIPQADEQQRLLANLIEFVNRDQMPLPRFWYFPRGEKAVVVMTGDDHASGGTSAQFDWDISKSPANCNVADWECVRATSYIYPNTPITDAAAAGYQAQGFEVSVHVNTNCTDWTPASLADFYATQLVSWASIFPSLNSPTTHRTHCITWSDWVTQPKVELSDGIRLDTNYYYWPGAWVQNRPGYFTGSGMPMRFADLDGSMVDVYQAATQMTDESGITYSTHINTLLDNALGANGYYGVITTNMHTDSGVHDGQQTVVNAALARGVPVVSAAQMLTWLDGRNASSFEDLTWTADTLTFSIAAAAGSNGLETMLPTRGPNGTLQTLTLGSIPAAFSTQTIKGVEYAIFPAAAGTYTAVYGVDTTAPAISQVLAVPGADGTATVTWTTDEPATSRVDYGTTADALTSNVTDPALTTAHVLHLTGLGANATYYFRVTSADGTGLTSVSPNPLLAPATFTMPSAVATDTTVADFSAGTTGMSTYVSDTAGGEIIMAPAVGAEFPGSGLPSAWSTGPWTGGATSIANGHATIDGSWIRADGLVGTGRAIEFAGTFSGDAFQNAGFGVTLDGAGESWAMFGTNTTAGTLQARTLEVGGNPVDVALGAQYIGSQHLFRIEWDSTAVRFYIDGALVHTAATVGGTMRPIASDYDNGAGALSIDWMRMTPYASTGTFLSRMHDAGSPAAWGALSYAAIVPGGTTLALSVRTGSTPTADGTWTAFSPVTQGQVIGGSNRYLQYRAEATSATGDVTPVLSSVTIPYSASADTTAPAIISRTPAPNATQVAIGTNVNVTFDEPINPATITTSTITLRAAGASSDVPATVTYAGATATLNPTNDLTTTTTYTVTVAGSVADTSGNSLGSPDSWTFTTSAPLSKLVDTTTADFGAGATGADTYVATTGDGEVTLAPTAGAEFQGTALPAGWTVNPWVDGGSATVGGGNVVVDEAAIWTNTFYTPGRVLEFEANFSDQNQHAGFANDFNDDVWAIFSTGRDGDQLYARSMGGVQTPLGTSFLDGRHLYRIEWTATSVRYLIDGQQVALHTGLNYSQSLRPAASDSNPTGSLTVDWMRMTPYAGSGTFISRVLDAGVAVDWRTLDVTATTPVATDITFEVRTGDTASPGAGWSAFTAITAGGDIAGTSRYIQYRATLTSTDADTTPSLQQIAIGYIAPADETPPTIITQSPAPNATGVAGGASVNVSFSESVDPATVTTDNVHLQRGGVDVPATLHILGASVILVPIVDLDPYTTYTATITTAVTDMAGNHLATNATWSFTTGGIATAFVDDKVLGEFGAGSPGSTYVAATSNGEVILAPTIGAEFDGTSPPNGWSSKPTPWADGGAVTVAGGTLTVDGTMAATATTFGPGRSLEFVATFQPQPGQHVGFVGDLDFNAPWAIVSTGNTGNDVLARTSSNPNGISLGAGLLGSSHRYRIDWTATGFDFSVDGAFVTTIAFQSGPMLVGASDYNAGTPLVVDWMRMSPYAGSGTFESRLFDSGSRNNWTTLATTTSEPSGTSATFETRTGDSTDTGEASWSAWASVSAGAIISPNARYIQYRATLTSADPAITPVVERVELTSVSLPNEAPIAADQTVTTAEDTAKPITLTGTDGDGGTLTYTVGTAPTHGALTGTIPNLTYTPAANYNGTDSFTFTASDGTDTSNLAIVSITITAVNDTPIAGSQTVTTAEDTSVDITLSALDVDGDTLSYAVGTAPTHGTLSGTGANLTYTPAANYHGPDTFLFAVNDGTIGSNNAIVSITITAVNDAPAITNPGAQSSAEGDTVNMQIVATDIDNAVLTYTASGLPNGLTINPASGLISGTVAFDAAGAHTVTATASDATLTATTTFNWAIAATNRAPVAANQNITTTEDTAKAITLAATDADGDTLTYTITTPPTHGTLSGTGANLTYTPAANYHGPDTFLFAVNDGTIDSNNAIVSITVVAVESSPPTTGGTGYKALLPARVLESRVGAASTIDGQFWQIGQRTEQSVTELTIAGRAGIPADAAAVVLNITVTEPSAPGFVTVYPCGEPTPGTSNLNYLTGSTVANIVIAKLGTNGNVCLYTSTATHLIVDLNGYYPAGG